MMEALRFERVEPYSFADAAAKILQESWQPPCIRYSGDYLRWLFSFPEMPPAIGMVAFVGEEPAGFLAALPWRMRFRGSSFPAWQIGLGAVRPNWRGLIAVGLYRKLGEAVRATGWPHFAFPEGDSQAEKFVAGTFATGGYQRRPFGEYRTYGHMARAEGLTSPVSCTVARDDSEFLASIQGCIDAQTVWNNPGPEQLAHYRQDPRRRALVVLRGPDGGFLGAGMLVRSEVVTLQGTDFVPTIASVYLPAPCPDVLRALLRFAATHYAGQVTSAVITAANLHGIDPVILRQAGLRATATWFQGHLFATKADEALAGAQGTNLAISG
jgi:hypothetical protein